MIALIQRVLAAKVDVAGETVGEINHGLLALIGVTREDDASNMRRLAERLLAYRIFQDDRARMNLSVRDVSGGLLLVPQFTLAADTHKGNRPGFSTAAEPERALTLFDQLVSTLRAQHSPVATGRFGAEMIITLQNHGPVTFWLEA